ncbi:MAG: asparagine synthase (glutamine-hydrolyzing) [Carnobacterium sp.]|jgi:asparagine synthase (glutamine-hydrolysing)|uniref:asparagine synthase (glutamine-hydrolyzing) n=2 Tax=Carnobacterium maltaromaticum TaxID=2751 RepID=K8E5D3_CARML|nr:MULTISPECIES: asparagine synthase (glutamine-hydrolyzing) [Carnobacterium]AOA02518.1 asparagine synthase (glutamine-hydrolyzing) [Carnobacterium maltaromaticum]KRN59971.1 asparagine synthase 1 [Carnobacterium maltaromaticum DSM 20342]KRN85530.1 asparagine synthase 1 [Carnobacterium maltaromaticum]MBC9789133.1 asparagine synthase (glutamine-hydrolyzing) [Carnobacterium maltaromaticum]MBQ6484665.1 asparagine synthase (glutamine-hydrolyzing) [Carnobacterium sp.]
MCGFVGCIHGSDLNDHDLDYEKKIKEMNKLIVHRGPDDEGFFFDDHISFGFRRLSIIDVEKGHQPLSYENERYWIVFNGEVYNYIELRDELIADGLTFETDSDTEVIIATYAKYKEKTAERLRGMFGFVIWDKVEKSVYGARDHFGIKPFHYAEEDGNIYFASEKKSIYEILKKKEINPVALQNYLTFQFVPDPETLTENIHRLPPGHYFTKPLNGEMEITRYWEATFAPIQKSEDEFAKAIKDVLYDSVEKHMRSDVTVGSFLSGGVDSSIIVAIAREFNPKIKTISVGFEREGYSEIDVAKETADRLNVENISEIITAQQFMDEFPRFVWHMDDPLADPAAVPQFFLAEIARKHVKVALSGEGADEVFGGYTIYNEPNSLKRIDSLPSGLKKGLNQLAKIMPEGMRGKSFIQRGTTPMEQRYVGNAKIFEEAEKKKLMVNYLAGHPYQNVTKPFYDRSKGYDPIDRMQYIDIHTWLNGDLLLNADRTTMAASLELRTPFLDKEVFKVARELPSDIRIANGTTKYILRKAAESFVPDNVLYRKKLGFPVPIRHWLKDEMNSWVKGIIADSQTDHLINKSYVLGLLEDHCAGKLDNSRKIWTVITFMVWHKLYVETGEQFLVLPNSKAVIQ